MATFEFGEGGSGGIAFDKIGKSIVLSREIDFALTAYAGVVGTDLVNLIEVPKNFVATRTAIRVITAAGGVVTCTFGDVADPNGWMATADLNAVGTTLSLKTDAYDLVNGKFYAVATKLGIVPSDVLLIAKIKVFVQGYSVEVDTLPNA